MENYSRVYIWLLEANTVFQAFSTVSQLLVELNPVRRDQENSGLKETTRSYTNFKN